MIFVLVTLIAGPGFAYAQTAPLPDIDTNRPSFMASPLVLPARTVQVENGTLFSGQRHGNWAYDLPETEIRVGVFRSTELQMFVPDFYLERNSNSTFGRVSDLAEIGLKQQLSLPKTIAPKLASRLNFALIASLSAPTGSPQISGGGVQPVLRLPYTVSLNDKWAVGGMQSLLVVNSGHDVLYQPDVLLSRAVNQRSSAFIEYGGSILHHHNPQHLIHFGTVYKISRCQQIDTQFGFGLNESAPSAFVGAGYSVRFDQLRH